MSCEELTPHALNSSHEYPSQDIAAPPFWLARNLKAMNRESRASVVSPRLRLNSKSSRVACSRLSSPRGANCEAKLVSRNVTGSTC